MAISLILLGIVVEDFKSILPPFLESGYATVVQGIITGLLFIQAVHNSRQIGKGVQKEKLKHKLKLREKITFVILVYAALLLEFIGNFLATNIFLLNLFAISYMEYNNFREFLLIINDYVLGLLVFPLAGWFSFWAIRKQISTKLEECLCSRVTRWNHKNWILVSLVILIFFNLILIFK